MKPLRYLAACATIGSLLFGAHENESHSPTDADAQRPRIDVAFTETGFTAKLVPVAEGASRVVSASSALVCKGTYTVRKVNNTLEWGSQNACSSFPATYRPQRIQVTLEGTCTGMFCLSWPREAGPVTSAWTNGVATAQAATKCKSNTSRRFRLAVHVWYKYGALDMGTVRSAPYTIACDV